MNSKDLREIIKSLIRPEDCVFLDPAPVIHEGFPSCFNLSFAEYELFHRYDGQYLRFDSDYVFSKSQPCIRHQDWETIVEDENNRYRYLSLFEMVDISGFILRKDGSNKDKNDYFAIENFIKFM